jgi:hypothetical protein
MKRFIGLGVLGMVGIVGACGGSGSQGPAGQAGPAGSNGMNGEAGAPGASGSATVNPSLSGITPERTFLSRTIDVTISGYGTNWSSTTTVDFGTDITVNKLTVASPTALVANITTTQTASVGPRDVNVKDGSNTETYKGAFEVLSPLSVTFQGNVSQGGNVIATLKVLDTSTPLDTTVDATTGAFTNIAVSVGNGITADIQSVTDFGAQVELFIDVSATAATSDFDLVSGPPGTANADVDFLAPKALNVAAVTPTALVAGTAVNGSLAAPYDTTVYSFTPASAAQTILDFSISTTSSTASPGLYLLPTDGKWADFLTGALASGGPGSFSYVASQTTALYGITWDPSGGSGPYSLAGVVATASASTGAATANDATTAAAIPATTFPFVLTGGDLSHSGGNGDWVKVTMPAGMTSLRVQSSGDTQTDAVVNVTTDGSTQAGTPPATTETGSIVDATFTGLTPGSTYYVTYTEGFTGQLEGLPTDYTGIIRALP